MPVIRSCRGTRSTIHPACRSGTGAVDVPGTVRPRAQRVAGHKHLDRLVSGVESRGQAMREGDGRAGVRDGRGGGPRAAAGAAAPRAGLRGGVGVSRVEEFEELRPLLFSIAYRILGSVVEAEDAVQESWLRYQGVAARPASPKAFLSAVVTRVSIDVLRSARVRRETY